jgi:protein SCO1/2
MWSANGLPALHCKEVFMQHKLLWRGVALIGGLAIISGILFISVKPSFHGAVINPPIPAAEIKLTDFNGAPFTLSNLYGKVIILYFGYTNCPNECPLTMAHLKLTMDILGDKSKDVKVVMITTDPTRDNAESMKTFLGKFDSDFIGLVGAPDELMKVWKDYGVTVEDGGETHSYFIYMIDQSGKFRETFLPDSLPVDIAADTRLLLGE